MMAQIHEHAGHRDGTPAAAAGSCEEFQAQMPELVGAGKDVRNHEHLKNCARCTELLADLEYIAGMAGALLQPVHEPDDGVWKKISASIGKIPEDGAESAGSLKEVPS